MNWDRVKGNWKMARGRIKEKWGELTDDDLQEIEGRRGKLVGKIQKRYGMAREEADQEVREWEKKETD